MNLDTLTNVKTKEVSKGTILLEEGTICNAGFRVLKGCLKSYVLDSSGKEHILQFAPENWIISDLESYSRQTPSKIYVEAIENSEVAVISTDALPDLESMEKALLLEMNRLYRNNLMATHNRLISLLSATSEERYLEFLDTYPNLIQRLPLKLIASYLGMTPEHLSHTRGKLARKG